MYQEAILDRLPQDRTTREYVLPLRHVTRAGSGRAGAKAANLGDLTRAGFPVPDGFVLTTDALEQFLATNALDLQARPITTLPPHVPTVLDCRGSR